MWYASYGSNIHRERFIQYISGCSDKTPPQKEKALIIEHPIYFANKSSRWEGKGVAFLDTEAKGMSYGKMYLITREQFKDIRDAEGAWYSNEVTIGKEDGINITHSPRYEKDEVPAQSYLEVIKKGIRDTYPDLDEVEIDAYLMKCYIDKESAELLRYLRQQEHGVKISKIAEDLKKSVDAVIDKVGGLRDLGLIKQDGRSIRAGLAWRSPESLYYTVLSKRETIDSFDYK